MARKSSKRSKTATKKSGQVTASKRSKDEDSDDQVSSTYNENEEQEIPTKKRRGEASPNAAESRKSTATPSRAKAQHGKTRPSRGKGSQEVTEADSEEEDSMIVKTTTKRGRVSGRSSGSQSTNTETEDNHSEEATIKWEVPNKKKTISTKRGRSSGNSSRRDGSAEDSSTSSEEESTAGKEGPTKKATKRERSTALDTKANGEGSKTKDDSSRDIDKELDEVEESPKAKKAKAKIPKKEREKKEFEVDFIKDMRKTKNGRMFRVHWVGYKSKDDTWELEKDLNCGDKLIEFFGKMEKKKEMENDPNAEFEVERVVSVRMHKGKREFKVHWKNFPRTDETWEPEDNLDCQELIDEYLERFEQAKLIPEKVLRLDPKRTDRVVLNMNAAQRTSRRIGTKRVNYQESYLE